MLFVNTLWFLFVVHYLVGNIESKEVQQMFSRNEILPFVHFFLKKEIKTVAFYRIAAFIIGGSTLMIELYVHSSDFNNLMGITSKQIPNNILKNF